MSVINQVFRISHMVYRRQKRNSRNKICELRYTDLRITIYDRRSDVCIRTFCKRSCIYFRILLIRAVLSWIQPNPYNPLVRTIYKLVDPVTYRISRIIPTRVGMIDFAPFILMILIVFLQRFLIRSLFELGTRIN